MSDPVSELMRREILVARRLARLFRLESSGHLRSWPAETARRLIDRRGRLIDELTRLEERRRSLAPWVPNELELTMGVLTREVARGEQRCLEFLAEIGARLSQLRGEGAATGLRDGADGRLLGRG
ncbi:MAG TPA: hypothetical protein VGR70_14360 [Stellaceae bacterium]|nr:hypothetical protein [Stellaceae bacterium]